MTKPNIGMLLQKKTAIPNIILILATGWIVWEAYNSAGKTQSEQAKIKKLKSNYQALNRERVAEKERADSHERILLNQGLIQDYESDLG